MEELEKRLVCPRFNLMKKGKNMEIHYVYLAQAHVLGVYSLYIGMYSSYLSRDLEMHFFLNNIFV